MKITEHAQFVVAMNTIVAHSEFVDQLDMVCTRLASVGGVLPWVHKPLSFL